MRLRDLVNYYSWRILVILLLPILQGISLYLCYLLIDNQNLFEFITFVINTFVFISLTLFSWKLSNSIDFQINSDGVSNRFTNHSLAILFSITLYSFLFNLIGSSNIFLAYLLDSIVLSTIAIIIAFTSADFFKILQYQKPNFLNSSGKALLYLLIVIISVKFISLLVNSISDELYGFVKATDIIHNIALISYYLYFLIVIPKSEWAMSFPKNKKYRILFMASLNLVLLLFVLGINTDEVGFIIFSRYIIIIALSNILFLFKLIFRLIITLPSSYYLERKSYEMDNVASLVSSMNSILDEQQANSEYLGHLKALTGSSFAWLSNIENGDDKVTFSIDISKEIANVIGSKLSNFGGDEFVILGQDRPLVSELKLLIPHLKSIIINTITVEDKLYKIYLGSYHEIESGKDLIKALTILCDSYKISLKNIFLLQNRLELERYKSELLLAKNMQQKLLPNVKNVLGFDIDAVCIPAEMAGGDFYIVETGRFGILIAIADVSGKGVSAAFLGSQFLGAVKVLANKVDSLDEFCQELNVFSHGFLSKSEFITASFFVIGNDNKFHYARCGHLPALIFNKGKVEVISSKGMGLGLIDSAIFDNILEVKHLELSSGSFVIMMSDGLTEANNESKIEFELEGVKKSLIGMDFEDSESINKHLLLQLNKFVGTNQVNDDIALISIKIR